MLYYYYYYYLVTGLLQPRHCVLSDDGVDKHWREELERICDVHGTPSVHEVEGLVDLLGHAPVDRLEKLGQCLNGCSEDKALVPGLYELSHI